MLKQWCFYFHTVPSVNIQKIRKISFAILLLSVILLFTFSVLNFFFPLRCHVSYSTIVTDHKKQVIHAFLAEDDKWRIKAMPEEISPVLRKTILFKEDKYFYYHPGVNLFALMRAATLNILTQRRTSGASTITMQVARMLEPKRRTYIHKVIEMFRALQLEWSFSKDEILQLYFNLLPYGGNIEGVKSASLLFFKKEPSQLSLAEATVLCIVPNRPSSLRLGGDEKLLIRERNKWLRKFGMENLFDKNTIAESLEEPIEAVRTEAPKEAPHLAIKLRNKFPLPVIQTYLQMQMQMKIEKLLSDYTNSLYAAGIENASVIVCENSTGHVIAYAGSSDFYNYQHSGQVNGASAVRQPGSTLKPFIYGKCFDAGLLTPKTVMTDVPVNFDGFQPENYDEKFHGYVSVEYALKNSLNIPAVKALDMLDMENFIQLLKNCRFRQIEKDEKKLGLSLALGGCGVTLEELTALYAAMANKGMYRPLRYATAEAGDTLQVQILSESAAYMLTKILSASDRSDMPVAWSQSANTPKIAWKTGTSYGRRDAWSIGFNKKYTVGVWVGNFSGVGVPELNGASIATPLLFRIFNTIDYKSVNEWYAMPKECGIRMVCAETGHLPSEHCKSIVTDEFIPLVSSSALCEMQKELAISADEKISYCKNCQPATGYKKKVYTILSPEMQSYYEEQGIGYKQIPPHNPDCEKIFTDGGPGITFPVNGTEYLISKTSPEPLQLRCHTGSDVKKVYWYINNKLHSSTPSGKSVFFEPDEGKNKISCTDDKGRNTDIWITVKYVSL